MYGEDPPMASAAAPAVWEGMRASGQTPSFALMVAVKKPMKKRLFEFQGATVAGDDVIAWIADDSSKPGRPTGAPGADVTCWVAQSTPAYAARRVKAMATVPGTTPHQALLNEVAEEMTEALLALAAKCAGMEIAEMEIEIAHAAAHRWGAAFPDDGAVAAAAASGKGCLFDVGRRVVGCGDFCVAPKIEGAALSGAAAAARVVEMITDAPAASL